MIPVLDAILGQFSEDLGIDLGTANILVAVRGKGIVVREPSIISLNKKTKKIIAIGSGAKKMLGRTPASIETVRPLKEGVISDFDSTAALLSHFVKKIHDRPGKTISIPRPRMVIGVPSTISEVERRAVLAAAHEAGGRSVHLVEEPMAAAIGAGLSVWEPVGNLIVDIGGGTCEIASISLSGIVSGKCLKIGGDSMNRDIIGYVRSRHGLAIGEATAEEIKIVLGSAYPTAAEKEMIVRGRDLEKGLPKSIRMTSSQVREALTSSVSAIVSAIREVIEDTPPELAADIAERGIVLCGGGSQLLGLPKLISQETKMPVYVASEPLACVVLGCAKLLEDSELLKKIQMGVPAR